MSLSISNRRPFTNYSYSSDFGLNSEIFRFVAIRPPQYVPKENSRIIKISLNSTESDSEFIQNLKRARSSESRDMMIKNAKEFVASPDFVDTPKIIDEKYVRLAMAIKEHADQPIKDYLKVNYDKIFSEEAHSLVLSPEFKKTYERITNSVIASIIVSSLPAPTNSFIVSVLYAFYLIVQLAANSLVSARIIDAKLVLPSEIFPLPEVDRS